MISRGWNLLVQTFDERGGAARREGVLARLLPLSTLALVLVTRLLWSLAAPAPRVAWFAFDPGLFDRIDTVAFPLLVAALVAAVVLPWRRASRAALATSVFAMAALILGDQQRLQPWAYQHLLWSIVLLTASAERALALLRLLTVSVYVYSAWSKLDASFAETLGPRFIEALAGLAGLSVSGWSPLALGAAALLLPLGELAVGVGLCLRRARRGAVVAACAMHVATIAALSPWGLDHRPGVWIWNAWFIAQDLLLFWPRSAALVASERTTIPRRRAIFAELVAAAALVWPLSEPWGWCDLWPAWGLYAARAERVAILVHADDAGRVPAMFRDHLARADDEGWRAVRLDAWSVATFDAPLYPQQRYQLGLARAIAATAGLRHPVQTIAATTANRFTARRDAVALWGPVEVADYGRRFWFSSEPQWRPASSGPPAVER